MDFGIQFWKQCCSVKHDRMNFNYVSFESILIIIHEIYMIIVIHPTTCSQHSIDSGFCFFLGRTVYKHNTKSKFPLKQVFVISKPGIWQTAFRHTCCCTYQLPFVRNWDIVISSRFSEHDLKAKSPLFKVHKRNFVTLI